MDAEENTAEADLAKLERSALESAWLERMRRFLFIESPEETEDPLEAAAEVVRFFSNNGAWDDFPFEERDLPDMSRTVRALDLSGSWTNYWGWSGGSICDLVNYKEKNTRCTRCRTHVDRWWNENEAFEREVARLTLLRHGGCVDTAKFSVNPEMTETDCYLVYLDWDAADRIRDHIDALAARARMSEMV
jgi:hypothetical protein